MNQLDFQALFSRIANSSLDLTVTAMTPEEESGFYSENLSEFYPWAMLRLSDIFHAPDDYRVSLVVRVVSGRPVLMGELPAEYVGGCFIDRHGLYGLSVEEMQAALAIEIKAGVEPGLTIVDWKWLEHRL